MGACPFVLEAGSGSPPPLPKMQRVSKREAGKRGIQVLWGCPTMQCAKGAHLIHGILREVELGQAGGVDKGHICPPAEEDKGAGGLRQRAQEHLDVVFLLGVGMGGEAELLGPVLAHNFCLCPAGLLRQQVPSSHSSPAHVPLHRFPLPPHCHAPCCSCLPSPLCLPSP